MAPTLIRLKPLLLITAIVAIVFAPLGRGLFFATGDMRDVFIPLELFFQQELRAGRIPSWNPDISWGFPVLASAQIGFFYPLLLIARFLPISIYLPLVFFGHFVALALGLFFLLRRYALKDISALLGALSFTLGMFVIQHTTHLNIILAIAWLPWQLVCADYLIQTRKPSIRILTLLCLSLGIPFLIGQLQVPFFSATLTCLYILYRYIYLHGFSKHLLITFFCVSLSVLGISAAQILPTAELIQFSSRGAGGNFDLMRANQHSFPLLHVPTFIFPRFYGKDSTYWGKRLEIEYGVFIGTIPLLLALSTIRPYFLKNPIYRFWISITGISFLLALGTWSPFRLVGIEPSLWVFSAPARWLLLTTLGLSILSAYGWDYFQKNTASYKKLFSFTFLGLTFSVLAYNFIIFVVKPTSSQLLSIAQYLIPLHKENNYYIDKISILLSSMGTSGLSFYSPYTYLPLAIIGIAVWQLKKKNIALLLGILTIIELSVVAATASPLVKWDTVFSIPPTIALLPNSLRSKDARLQSIRAGGDTGALFTDPHSKPNAEARIQQKNLLVSLLSAQFNIPGIEWPASLDFKNQYEIVTKVDLKDLNIGAIVVPNNLPQPTIGTLHNSYQKINIYSLPFKARATVVDSEGNSLEKATARYENITPTLTRVTTNTPEAANVVVRDTWYPDWQAIQNGKTISLQQSPPFFRTFSVPTGTSVTELHYTPKSIYYGMIITLVTGSILGAVLIGSILLQYRKPL